MDANGNITIDNPDEISTFLNYMNNNDGASINDMSNHVISAGNGFSWELDAVTITGRGSFESGGWLTDAQGRVSDAVGLMGNVNSVAAANHGGGSFFGNAITLTDKHFNGGLGTVGVALKGYHKLPNNVKRHYAYKL